MKGKAVVILSGGMDSTTLLYDVKSKGYDIHAISFDYRQKHSKELGTAMQTCIKLKIPWKKFDLSVLNEVAPSALTRDDWEVPEGHYEEENMKQTVVPCRNLVMLSLASAYAVGIKAKYLFYGAHRGDHAVYPDCRQEFIKLLSKTILHADWHEVQLKAPYSGMDKGDIAIRGKELGVDYSLTWTCYRGKEKACGKCGACQERLEAFKKAEMDDPIEYE